MRTALLIATIALAGEAAAADAPIAASVPAAVEAVAAGGVPPTLCATGCLSLAWPGDPDGARLGARSARAIGLAAGAAAGLALAVPGAPADPRPLAGVRPADALVVGGALAASLAARVLADPPAGLAAGRISDCHGPEPSLPGVDACVRRHAVAATPRGRSNASRASDVTLAASIAYPYAVVLGAAPERQGRDLLVASGSLVVTAALTDAAKRVFARPRPWAHFCEPQKAGDMAQPEAHKSFFSGHSSMAFAGAVVAGSLARQRGLPNEGWVWATGLTMATTTGVLRLVSDKHYATDVAVGAATGALAGWLLPRLHRPGGDAPAAARGAEPAPVAIALPLPAGPRPGAGLLRVGYGSGPFVEAAWSW
jgi:membrane-associated phospholipid phosphatase